MTDLPPGWSREWGSTFDAQAAIYDAVRPSYPPALYDLLSSRCGLGPGCRVLEVGCGTGQATRDLVDRGASVVAVEPGPAMAALARDRLAGAPVTVVESKFEEWECDAPGSFDLAVSATAFHWVEPGAGLAQVAAALRPGGWLALWWMRYHDPGRPDPFSVAVGPLINRWDPRQVSWGPSDNGREVSRLAGRSEEFGEFTEHLFPVTGRHTARELRELWSTYSVTATIPSPGRERLLDEIERLAEEEFGGVVERPYVTACYLARRA